MTRPKLLVLTSGYQRWANDPQYNEDFVTTLTQGMTKKFNTYVLAPDYPHSSQFETINNVLVYRHPQSPFPRQSLAYDSGIIPKIKKNKLYLLLVPFFMLFQLIDLIRVCQKHHIDIIHAHWLLPQALNAVIYKHFINRHVKVIATAHGSDIFALDHPLLKPVKVFIVSHLDGLTVVSNIIKDKIEQLGPRHPPIHVLPMGVDTQLFRPHPLPSPPPFHVLFVGSIVENKGVRLLIQAIPKIVSSYANIKLSLIGTGNLENELRSLVLRLKINKQVKFVGHVPHHLLPKHFSSAHLFVLPSYSEGFPLVVSEALSCGKVTLVSNLPVFTGLIKKHPILLTFSRGNVSSLSRTILKIIKHYSTYQSLGSQARQYAITNLDWSKVKDNYCRLILSLLN